MRPLVLYRGLSGIGAEPDGEYVPESPAKLLREGKFHRGIGVMVGQNAADVSAGSCP